jgi:hypothetical protein
MWQSFDETELRLSIGIFAAKKRNIGILCVNGHWRPHLMFFVPDTDPEAWGAGLPSSPVVVGVNDPLDRLTLLTVPVGHWSDGKAASAEGH